MDTNDSGYDKTTESIDMKTFRRSPQVPIQASSRPLPRGFKVAAVLVLLCLGAELTYWQSARSTAPALSAAASQMTHPETPLRHYFRAGQWLADARTLAAVVHYLCEAEPLPRTNHLAVTATGVKIYS
jgi:hypothetical protein